MKISKEKILDSATALIRKRGYDGVSIKDVADSVGLQKSSIYSHFSGKDELVVAILDKAAADLSGSVCLTGDTISDFRQSLGNIVNYLKEFKKCLGMQLIYNSGPGDEDVTRAARNFFLTLKNSLGVTLKQNFNIPSETIEIIVEDSISRIEGSTVWLIIADNTQPLNRAVESSVKMVESLILEHKN